MLIMFSKSVEQFVISKILVFFSNTDIFFVNWHQIRCYTHEQIEQIEKYKNHKMVTSELDHQQRDN